jgi:hypothetical protein
MRAFDLHLAHGVCRDEHGTPWALGDRYKASFRAGATEFVPALGNDTFAFTLDGGDPAAPIALLSLGLGAPPAACGPCTFTAPAVTEFVVPHTGSARFVFPLPCEPAFLGFRLEFSGCCSARPRARARSWDRWSPAIA